MPFDKNNAYQNTLCRYVNQKNIFWSYTWEEFIEAEKHSKKVQEYLKIKEVSL